MSLRWARAIAYSVVALLAVVAILLTRPLPTRSNTPAGEILSEAHTAHLWRERYDTVGQGESLVSVLARGGVSEIVAREALKPAKMLDPRRIPAGMQVLLRTDTTDTLNAEIILRFAVDRLLHLKRDSTGWKAEEVRLPWKTDTIVVEAVIKTNLYEAMDAAARDVLPRDARYELTNNLADIFEYRVDMSRDLQIGDRFRVMAVRRTGPQGAVRMDSIIAATMKLSGATTEAVRFRSIKATGDFFDATGRSLRTGFLHAPLEFRRISSVFGLRRHPILGTMRRHQGIDYAASPGTTVRAIGNGVVIKAQWSNGYGNMIEIRHPNGFISRYGHMRRYVVYAGSHVTIGQKIGEVGSTGLSTGPHLHFEVLVNGDSRNPKLALRNASSDPIPNAERATFADRRTRLLALLETTPVLASAESASVRQAGAQRQ
jgi:murein DD-endopeptidase MepM/ murein hydrolase activator NlpD